MSVYEEAFKESLADPATYWNRHQDLVDWIRPPSTVLDRSRPPFYRWFADGSLNTCFDAVDRHVLAGHGDRAAIIYDSPVTGAKRTITYAGLLA